MAKLETLKIKLTGIRPLVMHNGLLADPTNPTVIRIREITSKGSKKMTVEDHKERDRLEWEGGLYWDDSLGPVIPSDNLERLIQFGARKSRRGKDVEAAVLVAEDVVPVQYSGPRDPKKLYGDGNTDFVLRKGVKIGKARVIRIRPKFPTWEISFTAEFDGSVINQRDIIKAVEDAGRLVGLGDYRPKYGRFIAEFS